jgi:hypothetical protein
MSMISAFCLQNFVTESKCGITKSIYTSDQCLSCKTANSEENLNLQGCNIKRWVSATDFQAGNSLIITDQ